MLHAFALLLAVTTNGTWSMQTQNGNTYMDIRWGDGSHHNSENGHNVNPADFGITNIESMNGHVEFKQHREAGDYAFEGWMNAGNGGGNYTLALNDAFFNELARRGYDVNEMNRRVTFVSVDMTIAYINSIESAGYHLSTNQLVTFKALNITQQYLNELKSAGISDLDENQVVSLKALKVDANYVRDLNSVGFSHLAAHDYVTFRALKIDSAYIKYLEAHGFKNLTPSQVVTMKAERI